MEAELDTQLIEKYAYMFETKTFPIGCDDGWHNLLDITFAKMKAADPNQSIRIHQIKEKFAGLRIYYESDNYDVLSDIVHKAEEASYKICEGCGRDGVLCSDGHWLKTLCDKCISSNNRYKKHIPKEGTKAQWGV